MENELNRGSEIIKPNLLDNQMFAKLYDYVNKGQLN